MRRWGSAVGGGLGRGFLKGFCKNNYKKKKVMSVKEVGHAGEETLGVKEISVHRRKYPYGPVFFLLGATVGQG